MMMTKSIQNHHGFGLLEVLISVIILAIGFLGIAALQTSAIRFNHSAELRSIAVNQLTNMAERLYANPAGVSAGNYNNLSGIPAETSCSPCTPADIAIRDMNRWNNDNAHFLPLGQGEVTGDGSLFTLTIRWNNKRSTGTGTGCSGDTSVDLTCLTMRVRL
jgi:type IV pilus assembly protein PilV